MTLTFLIIGGVLILGGLVYLLLTYEPNTQSPQERIKTLQTTKHSPNMNRYAARKEAGAAVARAEVLAAINTEAAELRVIDDAEEQAEVTFSHRQTEIIRNTTEQRELQSKRGLLSLSDGVGLDLPTYLKVEEKKHLNEADLNNELAKMREQVRLAIIAEHLSEHQKITLVNEHLDSLYKQIDEIEKMTDISEKTRQRMIEDREEIITTLKDDRRARQKGLLEAHNGGNLQRDSANPDDGGDFESPMETDSE